MVTASSRDTSILADINATLGTPTTSPADYVRNLDRQFSAALSTQTSARSPSSIPLSSEAASAGLPNSNRSTLPWRQAPSLQLQRPIHGSSQVNTPNQPAAADAVTERPTAASNAPTGMSATLLLPAVPTRTPISREASTAPQTASSAVPSSWLRVPRQRGPGDLIRELSQYGPDSGAPNAQSDAGNPAASAGSAASSKWGSRVICSQSVERESAKLAAVPGSQASDSGNAVSILRPAQGLAEDASALQMPPAGISLPSVPSINAASSKWGSKLASARSVSKPGSDEVTPALSAKASASAQALVSELSQTLNRLSSTGASVAAPPATSSQPPPLDNLGAPPSSPSATAAPVSDGPKLRTANEYRATGGGQMLSQQINARGGAPPSHMPSMQRPPSRLSSQRTASASHDAPTPSSRNPLSRSTLLTSIHENARAAQVPHSSQALDPGSQSGTALVLDDLSIQLGRFDAAGRILPESHGLGSVRSVTQDHGRSPGLPSRKSEADRNGDYRASSADIGYTQQQSTSNPSVAAAESATSGSRFRSRTSAGPAPEMTSTGSNANGLGLAEPASEVSSRRQSHTLAGPAPHTAEDAPDASELSLAEPAHGALSRRQSHISAGPAPPTASSSQFVSGSRRQSDALAGHVHAPPTANGFLPSQASEDAEPTPEGTSRRHSLTSLGPAPPTTSNALPASGLPSASMAPLPKSSTHSHAQAGHALAAPPDPLQTGYSQSSAYSNTGSLLGMSRQQSLFGAGPAPRGTTGTSAPSQMVVSRQASQMQPLMAQSQKAGSLGQVASPLARRATWERSRSVSNGAHPEPPPAADRDGLRTRISWASQAGALPPTSSRLPRISDGLEAGSSLSEPFAAQDPMPDDVGEPLLGKRKSRSGAASAADFQVQQLNVQDVLASLQDALQANNGADVPSYQASESSHSKFKLLSEALSQRIEAWRLMEANSAATFHNQLCSQFAASSVEAGTWQT
ncbi:hypothetical protein WJX74_000013 [Apatococcus lobatus]|uniref:Uncharacterized protein n=1 Tax=Apatococcus lobatus TaxID=904363 RepID=A0AAW1QUP1_9CHLO